MTSDTSEHAGDASRSRWKTRNPLFRLTKAAPLIWLLVLAPFRPDSVLAIAPDRPLFQNLRTTWTSKDGLPGDTVTEVLQDSFGYVWVGTFNGVVRFDGVHFHSFLNEENQEGAPRSATVFAEGPDRAFWIGTNGDGVVRYAKGSFSTFTKKEGLPSDVVRALTLDSAGNVYVGTSEGIARISTTGAVSVPFREKLPGVSVETLLLDTSGVLWCAVRSGPLHRIEIRNSGAVSVEGSLEVMSVLSMMEDQEGCLWIGTRGGKLFKRKAGTLSDVSSLAGLSGGAVNGLLKDSHGAIWVSTDTGLSRIYKGAVSRYDSSNGLSDDQVNRVQEDHEGNIWIATNRGGVSKLSEGKFSTITSQQGLANDIVNAILQDRDGNTWIATDRGLSVYRGGVFINHPLAAEVGPLRVRHVYQDRVGRIWVSTYGDRGVFVYDGTQTKTLSQTDGLTGNRCRMVFEDRSGVMWIATTSGLNRLENGQIRTFTKRDGLADDYILSVFEDSRRNLWVGTNGGGLYRFRDGKIEAFRKNSGLESDIVFGILEDSQKEIWAATTAGVSVLHNGSFHTYTRRNGLFGNAVFQMLEDRFGRFWMRADVGVMTASAEDMRTLSEKGSRIIKTRLYDSRDGLLGAQTPVSWASQTKSGDIWLPTLHGVAIIAAGHIPENKIAPKVYVEEILVDGASFPSSEVAFLEAGTRRVTFKYTGLSYQVPERVAFQVMLEGLDRGWSESTQRREATYTTLPPGQYTFKVRACNNDGIWSSNVAAVAIQQLPLFRQTLGFFLLLGLGFSGLAGGLFVVRTRALRRRKEELERLVENRTEEISRKNLLLEERRRELEESQALLRTANESLELLSRTDALTGLANRRQFEECLAREWKRSVRESTPIAILMLDVDCFKLYNDFYGHQAGDDCLRRVAAELGSSVRAQIDIPARYGGEEFIVVMPHSDLSGALSAGERIRLAVEALAIPHAHSTCASVVTVSAGAAAGTAQPGTNPEILIQAADSALYVSKQKGRNQVSPPE